MPLIYDDLDPVLTRVFLLAPHVQKCNFSVDFSHLRVAPVRAGAASLGVAFPHTLVLKGHGVCLSIDAASPAESAEIGLFFPASIFGSL